MTYADYDDGGPTYASITSSYFDLDGRHDDNPFFTSRAGSGILAPRLVAYDFANKGVLTDLEVEEECNAPAFLERVGLDLDTQGSDLATYKNVRRLFPQSVMYASTPVKITVGGSNMPAGPQKWGAPLTFDPTAQYKVDVMLGGRYLSYRFEVAAPIDFEVVGFDADVTSAGRR